MIPRHQLVADAARLHPGLKQRTDMPAPQYVKQQADEARKLLSRADEAPEEQTPEQEPSPTPTDRIELTDWENRYKLLRSSRDERFAKLSAEMETLRNENASLKEQVVSLQPKPEPQGFRVSDEDRELLGESGTTVVEKVTSYVDSQFESMAARQKAEADAAEEKRARLFLDDLGSQIPNWSVINKSPEFNRWLNETDKRLGVTHREVFDQHANNFDADELAKVFEQYLNRGGDQVAPRQELTPDPAVQTIEPSTEVFEEWWKAEEISAHYAEKNKLIRERRTAGPGWEAVMERQSRIDDAIANHRITRD